MWRRVKCIICILLIFVFILTASCLAEEKNDGLSKVTVGLRNALQKQDLSAWPADIDVLVVETLGTRFGWNSAMYGLAGNGEFEIVCPYTAKAVRLAAEVGVVEAMASVLDEFLSIDGTDYYDLAVLRVWILEGIESGFLKNNIFAISLDVIDYLLDIPGRLDADNIDETLLNEYVDVFKNVSSTKWIEILLAGGMEAIISSQDVFWTIKQMDYIPGYDVAYVDSYIIPLVQDWFLQQKDLLAQDMEIALVDARDEQDQLKIIVTGTIEYVDYFGNPVEGPDSGLMVNVSANETVLTSSMVHQNRFVLEFSGQELALHYPGKLTVSVNPEQDGLFRARLYEDLPVSLRLDDYSSRWLGEGLLVFSRIEPVRVQVIKDLVRVRVFDGNLNPQPGVVVTFLGIQVPTNSEGIVEIEQVPAGVYQVIAGLSSEEITVSHGPESLDVQIMLPDDEILSVPEEQRNNFAEMTLELVSLEKSLINEEIDLPEFFTRYNLLIRKAKEESMWLSATWLRYKDIRERNLHLVLQGQDDDAARAFSEELGRELARINTEWFEGQDEFLRAADEVLQKYLAKRVEMIARLNMLKEQVAAFSERTVSLSTLVSGEIDQVLQSITELRGADTEFAARTMERDVLEQGRAYLQQITGSIEDTARQIQSDVDTLSWALDELFFHALQYEKVYQTTTGEILTTDAVAVYREGLGALRKGEALQDSKYDELLDVYGKEVLARFEQIINSSNRLSGISTEILSRVPELPAVEDLNGVRKSLIDLVNRVSLVLERVLQDEENTETAESYSETMMLKDILSLFDLVDEIGGLREDTAPILGEKEVYETLTALLEEGKDIIDRNEYIFDDVLKQWEHVTGLVFPILEEITLLRNKTNELENGVLHVLGSRVEYRDVYEAYYTKGLAFAEKLNKEASRMYEIAEDPVEYAKDDKYEQLIREHQDLYDEYQLYWTGLMFLSEIEDAWQGFRTAYERSGVEAARRELEERRELYANLKVIEIVFDTDIDFGIDFTAGKTIPFSSETINETIADLEIVKWEQPRAYVPEGSGIRDLGEGALSTQFELPTSGYLGSLYLQEGRVYVIRKPNGMCAKIRVDGIEEIRRSIGGRLISRQYIIEISYLYPIPEELFQ